ncbi:DEKNAAC105024 [Brettanomyces naardenensis]|uniref:DEKNAAC105024 n=1 Tax=Brettanomyces naardenensis TaxID=13370 RepID=A0A448YRY6_BRENA|nr:DEKNAAC105024 [Brettanomyces naardenensis]
MSEISSVPDEIRKLVGPYIKRAVELEQYQPVISYLGKLYSAQLILQGQYHLKSNEVALYTEALLNDIETHKKNLIESSDKIADVVNDKEKSFKLVLGFSNVVFAKADKQVQNHNCQKQTVMDFKASIDFYQLLNLWDDLYQNEKSEVEKRTKYAKFQCARILKAIRNGEDPNEFTTKEEEAELEEMGKESIEGSNVTDVSGSAVTGSAPPDLPETPSGIKPEVPQTELPSQSQFPSKDIDVELPKPPEDIKGELNLPVAPVLIKGEKNSLGLPSAPVEQEPKVGNLGRPEKPKIPQKPASNAVVTSKPSSRKSSLVSSHSAAPVNVDKIWQQEEVIAEAQKRARFAISALNYEDIPTAISELEKALKLLRD